MKTTTGRVTRFLTQPAAALAATGAAVAFGGVATASTRPTIAMAITNRSAVPIHLVDRSPGFGWWRSAPPDTIPPHTTVVVTALTQDPGGAISATYQLPGNARATFAANNFGTGVDLDGTEVTGGDRWSLGRTVHAGHPDMSATYTLVGTP
ncbi:hypothetical protein [Rhodococcus sp. NPDC003348]